jgi:TatD DNase family protein
MIDTHAHIYAEEFNEDRDLMLQRAKDAGVTQILMPNIDEMSIEPMMQLANQHPGFCVPMMGLHPCYVKENYEEQLSFIRQELDKRTFIAVGEIGIDLYWDKTTLPQQQDAFLIQCSWAAEKHLPVAIHSRESTRLLIDLLQPLKERPTGVFHCFGGSLEEAQDIVSMGMYLGIGGVVTFKNSNLSEVLNEVGIDRVILETDAPYLAPVPYRGKRNEPYYLQQVVKKLSDILGLSEEAVISKTSENARRLFKC